MQPSKAILARNQAMIDFILWLDWVDKNRTPIYRCRNCHQPMRVLAGGYRCQHCDQPVAYDMPGLAAI